MPPTVFADVQDAMTIAREEIFGPVLSALPFDDEEEVIRRANDTRFGLAALRCGRATSAGRNGLRRRCARAPSSSTATGRPDPAVPFGGVKMSGYGRESGIQHVEEYLNVKAVFLDTA